MNRFLNTNNACFYHIAPFSKVAEIEQNGLRAFNPKGISVLRVFDMDIVNSIISLQLNSPEIVEENDFVVFSIPQRINNFTINEIQPDIVAEWTWPLHNNIVGRTIPFQSMEIVSRFSVLSWDKIAIEDFKNETKHKATDLYTNSFGLTYMFKGRVFTVNNQGEKIYN